MLLVFRTQNGTHWCDLAEMLSHDTPANYETLDDAIESIISDVEQSVDVSAEQAATIGDAVEEWWWSTVETEHSCSISSVKPKRSLR